ncbi:MAG: hypothetical protein ACWGOX_14350 [Desulforhopalus sp.]
MSDSAGRGIVRENRRQSSIVGFVSPEGFDIFHEETEKMGFKGVVASLPVRTCFEAGIVYDKMVAARSKSGAAIWFSG